jgi:hypothetical protein
MNTKTQLTPNNCLIFCHSNKEKAQCIQYAIRHQLQVKRVLKGSMPQTVKAKRLVLSNIITACKQEQVDCLIIPNPTALSSNLFEYFTLRNQLQRLGVQIHYSQSHLIDSPDWTWTQIESNFINHLINKEVIYE